MSLVTSEEILHRAMEEQYAVPAFNANCLEMIPALIAAAQLERAPLIVQIGKRYLSYAEAGDIGAYAIYLAKKSDVPVCIHLDHGADLQMAQECLTAGFTSIMYDGSALPMEENIRNTREVVRLSAARKIPVEGEAGQVHMADEIADFENPDDLTRPEDAAYFAEQTGVSSIAVAVGNVHRMLKKKAHIDFDRIKQIRRAVKIPMVIHGSSGISDDDVKRAVACGINKVNVATEFNREFVRCMHRFMEEHPDEIFPMEPISTAMEAVTCMARGRIRVTGADHKY